MVAFWNVFWGRFRVQSTWKKVTALVIVAVIVGLILYDLIEYAFLPGGNPGTISVVLLGAETRFPLLIGEFCFAMGMFVGHTMLYQSITPPTPTNPNPAETAT